MTDRIEPSDAFARTTDLQVGDSFTELTSDTVHTLTAPTERTVVRYKAVTTLHVTTGGVAETLTLFGDERVVRVGGGQ